MECWRVWSSAVDLTERKHAEEKVQLLAVTDPLTGLGNYRRLVEALDAEVKRTGRTGRPFAVLLLDLDQLKKINDRYGHLIGSQALCRVADVLRVFCRSIDTAARYGGDEFAVILPETTAAGARLVASRIRSRLADGLSRATTFRERRRGCLSPGRRNDWSPASHSRPRVVRDEASVRKNHSVGLNPCECIGAGWLTRGFFGERRSR